MSELTDEQKKRAEANRLKALALRAKRQVQQQQQQQGSANGPSRPLPTRTFASPSSSTFSSLASSSSPLCKKSSNAPGSSSSRPLSRAGGRTSVSHSLTYGKGRHSSLASTNVGQQRASTSGWLSASIKPSQFGEKTKATCRLLTRNSFCVECKYHGGLIQAFKTLPTRQYSERRAPSSTGCFMKSWCGNKDVFNPCSATTWLPLPQCHCLVTY